MRRGLRSARTAEFWAAVLLCVGLMVIATAHAATAAPAGGSEGQRTRSGNLVNQSRRAEGVASLERHAALDRVAAVHAQRMADADAIFHNDRLAQEVEAQGVKWKRLGENVGMGPTVEVIHDGFMASESHRHNVLQPQFHAFGVGVVVVPQENGDEKVFVVHVFGDLTEVTKERSTTHHVTPALRKPAPAPKKAAGPVVAVAAVAPRVRPAPVANVTTSPDPNALTGGVVVPLR